MSKKTIISSEFSLTDKDTGELITTYSIHIYNCKYCLLDANGNTVKEIETVYPQYLLECIVADYAREHNCNIVRKRVKTQYTESTYDFELNAFITPNEEYLITWK